MKARLLICYKIGYDPGKKLESKLMEVKEDGEKLIYAIPIVSGKNDLEFMINKQIPLYKELATSLKYIGPEKFHNFGQYC